MVNRRKNIVWCTIATWPFALQAVEKAAQILSEGGNAVDAAEQGIHVVESDPKVDSVGKGGWLNARGELEMDAAMMHGGTLRIGCVAAMQGFEHPVTVARAVMEKSKHNMIVGTGAEEFAQKCGIEKTDEAELVLPSARKQYEENCRKAAQEQEIVGHDTIGLIALDKNGDIVSATSTSGACMKTPGRVGDSPLIGSGFYAKNGAGACVASGLGEDIMRTCCCHHAVMLMEMGLRPQEAADKAVLYATNAIIASGNHCDCIAIVCMNGEGEVGASCNHQGFTYAYAQENTAPVRVNVNPIIDIGGIPNETKSLS